MVPNEAEAPFVVLEALNISSVISATTYFRRHLCVFFLPAKSPVRVLTLKPEVGRGRRAVKCVHLARRLEGS